MLFNSYQFIFIFLPLTWALYWVCIHKHKLSWAMSFLTAMSLVFYAYWNPPYVLLLLGSILVNYWMAGQTLGPQGRKWLGAGVVANLLLLGYFKYTTFIVEGLSAGLNTEWSVGSIFLPLGISFFTFHQITYLFDTHARIIPRSNLRDYTLYIAFFPQLIAGPVVRARQFLPQLTPYKGHEKFWRYTTIGLSLFFMGLAKKVLIADHMADYANPLFERADEGIALTFFDSWIAALSYSFQLYFDFSGYSDMALGLALMFGFRLPINFFSPYKSFNISEFWRRWHMTMSYFFRDYLYIPLGGSRCSRSRQLYILLLTMALVGLWHGAGWTFIVWGLLHGFYLCIHRVYKWMLGPYHQGLDRHFFYKGGAHGLTFLAVVVAWVFFRAESIPVALNVLEAMTGGQGITLPRNIFGDLLGTQGWVHTAAEGQKWFSGAYMAFPAIICAYLACILLPSSMAFFRIASSEGPFRICFRPDYKMAAFIGLMAVMSLLSMQRISEFLYFQF